jgi:hypothetical protein
LLEAGVWDGYEYVLPNSVEQRGVRGWLREWKGGLAKPWLSVKPEEAPVSVRLVGDLVAALVLAMAVVAPARAGDSKAEAAAMKVLDAFMTAFNARDVAAFEATLHFPHYRIASENVSVLQDPRILPDLFDCFVAAMPEWDHSAWDKRRVIHSGPDKVHIDTRFTRYQADGSVLASYDSLYIVTRQDVRWGVLARSSFAP